VVVGRWSLPFCETLGARKIYLAASGEWNGFTDAGTVVDVAGRDRLAASGAQLRSADGGVTGFIQN